MHHMCSSSHSPVPGSSSCNLCTLGSYSSALGSTACSPCPNGAACMIGAFQPTPAQQIAKAQTPIPASNPFTSEQEGNVQRQTAQITIVLIVGSSLGLAIFMLSVAAQKVDSIGNVLNCRSSSSINWVALDLFFSNAHAAPKGSMMQLRQTSFGGQVSCICLFVILMASVGLGILNLSPTYTATVTTDELQWQPRGMFELTMNLFGGGLDVCLNHSTAVAMTSGSGPSTSWGDWSSNPTTSFAFNAADGSCTALWSCPQCTLNTASSTSIYVSVAARAWVNYAFFSLTTPAFTTSADDQNAVGDVFAVSKYLFPVGISNLTGAVFGGGANAAPTVITVLLTPFTTSFNGVVQRIAYQPSVGNVKAGSVLSADSFSFAEAKGFVFRFDLTRNSITISKCVRSKLL
jgi:hypothetical protein